MWEFLSDDSDDFVGDFLKGATGELDVRPDGSIEVRPVASMG